MLPFHFVSIWNQVFKHVAEHVGEFVPIPLLEWAMGVFLTSSEGSVSTLSIKTNSSLKGLLHELKKGLF